MNKVTDPAALRTTLVGFKATAAELAALKQVAARLGVTVADVLRMAVRAQHADAFEPKHH